MKRVKKRLSAYWQAWQRKRKQHARLNYKSPRYNRKPTHFQAANFRPSEELLDGYFETDDRPVPVIIFPPPIYLKRGDSTLVFQPPRHRKLSRADYEHLRLCEANIDNGFIYDKMVNMAKNDPEFIKMIFWELVLVAPNDFLNGMIESYVRLKDSTGPKTGPRYWNNEQWEDFVKKAQDVENLAKQTFLQDAINKVFDGLSESYYRELRLEAERRGYKIKRYSRQKPKTLRKK